MTLPSTPREFLEAVERWALDGRRMPVPVSIDGLERGQSADLYGNVYRPFVPRYFIVQTWEGFVLEDVRCGQVSLVGGRGEVPASAYAITQQMLDNPNDDGWQRVRLDVSRGDGSAGGGVIHVGGEPLMVRVRRLEDDDSPHQHRPFCCAWLGNEATRRMWETTLAGRLVLVGVTADGCCVEVRTPSGNIERMAIAPSDVAGLVERLGEPIAFSLKTGK